MRAVVQRVSQASVTVDGEVVGAIDRGVMILLGVTHGDAEEQARWLANKIAGLRIYEDAEGKMNLGLLDVGGEALVVSQFTLYGDCRKGRRPSFTHAARPEIAEPLCERFIEFLRQAGLQRVESGVFGAHMMVEIHNDGPVTLIIERAAGSG
jgi:D-tyrosyl-tRNA(Tyr) deacylase